MNISTIEVLGLFGRFKHVISLDASDRITIMYGPNGFGKTTILRLINILFNSSLRRLGRLPFEEIRILFDDHSEITVTRIPEQANLKLTYDVPGRNTQEFTPGPQIRPQEIPFPINAIEELIPILVQTAPSEWRNVHSGEILGLEDVLIEFREQFPFDVDIPQPEAPIPPWLETIRTSIPVRFIDTERLTAFSQSERRPRHLRRYAQPTSVRTIRRYSADLGQKVKQTLTEYATLSQSLDRSFPARLVEDSPAQSRAVDELGSELANLERRRSEIIDAGLFVQEEESLSVPDIDAIDESKRSILEVYAQDATSKLGVFDDLYARVNTFMRIANERLLYKRIAVNQDGFEVSNVDGAFLELEMLSSGEQHEIVLLYDLLFETKQNSLILVDEPELSLHVAWQREMLNDLEEMAVLSDFHALLATHSPQIINDRWALTAELKGPTIT